MLFHRFFLPGPFDFTTDRPWLLSPFLWWGAMYVFPLIDKWFLVSSPPRPPPYLFPLFPLPRVSP